MDLRRLICAFTICTFLPVATGCATSARTVPMDVEPDPVFPRGEPIKVRGYTTADREFHRWYGTVAPVEGDSLHFEPRSLATNPRSEESFRLAREEVSALEIVEDGGGSTVGWILLGAAAVVVITLVVVAKVFSDFNDGWRLGSSR